MLRLCQPVGGASCVSSILVVAAILVLVPLRVASAVITFPDPGLETAIRSAMGKPRGIISDHQLAELRILDASGLGITDLEGIQYCTGLVELKLSQNAIVDLALLSHLASLEILDLHSNAVVNLSPLSDLLNITTMRLSNNLIADLAPLAGLSRTTGLMGSALKELELDENEISDISVLGQIASLQKLVLNDNQISSISELASLGNLVSLNLIGNTIVDIEPIGSLTGLKILLLDNNRIADISALSALEDLIGLWLSGNPITSLQPLVDNPGLDFGDRIYICSDQLDVSLAAQHILALSRRGVYVYECW